MQKQKKKKNQQNYSIFFFSSYVWTKTSFCPQVCGMNKDK